MTEQKDDWPPELLEWVYGPPADENDDPLSVGDVYHIQEEEDRIRWLPGYREMVLRFLALSKEWHAGWVPGNPYPPEPEEHRDLRDRLLRAGTVRARPPWEQL